VRTCAPSRAAPHHFLADTPAQAGFEARRVRFGHAEFRLDVRTGGGETTHGRVASLFDVPKDRLSLVASGRKLTTEDEARAAPVLLAVGTATRAHLPRVSLARRAASWLASSVGRAAGACAAAAPGGAALLRALRLAFFVLRELLLSLLLPSRAPELTPPPQPGADAEPQPG
jgi:hypothetical protein